MAMQERLDRARVERLAVWNQLFHGIPIALGNLDPVTLCGDGDSESERAAYVTLRACVALSGSARQAIRCALRVAILYWFSNVGPHRDGDALLDAKRSTFHLGEAIGTCLTWDEAMIAMKRKPIDISAYMRLLELIEEEYVRQWGLEFPEREPTSIRALAGNIRDSEHARSWSVGLRGPHSGTGRDGD